MEEDSQKLISLKEASKMTPYSADYLSLLIRKGKLKGEKKDGIWHITESVIQSYLQKTAESSYEHQQNLNVKIPADEIKKAKVNYRWAILLLAVVLFSGLLIWKINDDKNNANILTKYRITEDKYGGLTIFVPDTNLVKSVKVMQKE